MKHILGIDQGGTKTMAAVIDETGRLLGVGRANGAYFPHHGIERALSEIEAAVNQALLQAGISLCDICKIIAGITGVDFPGDDTTLQKILEKAFGKKEIQVYNDCVIAFHAGTMKNAGAVICAGTGLNAAIYTGTGECFVYGDYLGKDMQGGSALAQQGIRAVFDASLGIGEADKLTELFFHFSGADTADKLLRMYMQDENFKSRIKLIVPEMIALAEAGDKTTDRLLFHFADNLSIYLRAGLQKYALLQEPIDIVLSGSVFKGSRNPLTGYLTRNIGAAAPHAVIINARYEPVAGACIMGLLPEKTFTKEMEYNLAESAGKLSLLRY